MEEVWSGMESRYPGLSSSTAGQNDLNDTSARLMRADEKEIFMSGEADKTVGRVKQAAGDLTDNQDLKNEGEAQESAGKVKDAIGDVADAARDAVDSLKDKITSDD